MYKCGWIRRLTLRDTGNYSLLEGLKVTSHAIAHREIFSRSVFRRAAEVTVGFHVITWNKRRFRSKQNFLSLFFLNHGSQEYLQTKKKNKRIMSL